MSGKNNEKHIGEIVDEVAQPLEDAAQTLAQPLQAASMKISARLYGFMRLEASGGIVLVVAALLALLVANSPWSGLYHDSLNAEFGFILAGYELEKTVLHWINHGLMAVFFFLVGLEVKRELMEGQLRAPSRALLPLLCAMGGMLVPALIYLAATGFAGQTLEGWAIPTATDIAFALGVLALLGSRAPMALKAFLLAVAIFDDIGAIIIISVFYSHQLEVVPFLYALAAIAALVLLNLSGNRNRVFYFTLGFLLWLALLKSGVHATLAGVITALTIPIREQDGVSPLHDTVSSLHPFVVYLILPLFAFANAGVSLIGAAAPLAISPVLSGVYAGLVLGKVIGVFSTAWLAVRTGLARLPSGVDWPMLLGVSALTGIGFTMSLFIGTLAFPGNEFAADIRLGVLAASLSSALIGLGVLRFALARRRFEN